MQRYTVYLYLETALHVSCGISTHHQEHTQLYLQHLALVKPSRQVAVADLHTILTVSQEIKPLKVVT